MEPRSYQLTRYELLKAGNYVSSDDAQTVFGEADYDALFSALFSPMARARREEIPIPRSLRICWAFRRRGSIVALMSSPTQLISWNVNGLRAVLKKGFAAFLASYQADIVCLQETKISDDLTGKFQFKGYPHLYWNCAEKKGYSGTAILSKIKPLSVQCGLGMGKHDEEGRVITAEFPDYYLVTVYTPNAQNHDENKRPRRLDYRTLEWDVAFLNYVKRLEQDKPVVFCGDLNVAHREVDLANPKNNRRNAGFTDEERAGFDNILAAGFVDSFRHLHPDRTGAYSWWSYRAAARERNVGWRIDYFCVSDAMRPKIKKADILSDVTGSDHCPVRLDLSL